jgi:hypothetical protein
MTCKIPLASDLEDLEYELALTSRPELLEVLDDMIERYPQHELALLRFVVEWLLD